MSNSTSEPAQNGAASTSQAHTPIPKLFQLGQLIDGVTETARLAHLARTTGQSIGVSTGFEKIDREFCGALPVGNIVLHGGSGAGKTALAFQIAATAPCPALFVSCEMAPEELFRRQMARVNGDYLNRYKSGEMSPEAVHAKATKAAAASPLLAIADLTRATCLPSQVEKDSTPIKYLQDVATGLRGEHPHFLLVIDSLHSWAMNAASNNRAMQGLGETEILIHALSLLNGLSHELNCPILLISERNRASMEKAGINSGAGTRRIEYGAEAVLALDVERDSKGNPVPSDGAGETPVELVFAKNRHGAAGRKVKLSFNGALMRFKQA